jgi:asparagine synthase (glutamine-hydrolysing)
MSGIVGIVSLDGDPVDESLLRRMTGSLTYRGPDRQKIWLDGPAGFGHTLLGTAVESEREEQPASLDGRVWITADARVDGRGELVEQLASRGRSDLGAASDAQLILHAYHAWGEHCVEHLLGDFAFAIWDAGTRRLFCARDHFGVKPFYYAQVRGGIVFSNTLDCVRLHPEVGDGLNELAIGDFLLFGYNLRLDETTFADVRRLAPAHSLTCGQGTPRPRRYWTLPTDGRIRYRRPHDYVDHFKELLRSSVADRVRTSPVGVWMSGGLDSASITATARQLLSERGGPVELRAHTIVYDTLIPDEERHYARIAAEALGIEISYFPADGYGPLAFWGQSDLWTPEPSSDPFLLMCTHQMKQAAQHSRVLLCGQGGDEVLWGTYVADLLGRLPLRELAADLTRSLLLHHLRPGAGIRSTLKKWLGYASPRPAYPEWLDSGFAERAGLRARWEHSRRVFETIEEHPLRPEAYRRLATAPWSSSFESCDPGATRIPIEARNPFLDVRLASYLLAIPPLPWCIDKQLLRLAMRGALPDPVRRRPKAPLAGDPFRAKLREARDPWWDRFDPTPELAQYVDRRAVPKLSSDVKGPDPWLNMRPLCLDHWLRRVHQVAV